MFLGGKRKRKGQRAEGGQKRRSQCVCRISQIQEEVNVKFSWKMQMKSWPKG